jgi:nucleotide-binding universal stress UspA family protein
VTTSTPIAPHDAADVDVRPEQPSGAGGPPADAVIVGVDGTECGLGAVRWAAQEAARRNAPLRIVHAAPIPRRGRSTETAPRPTPHQRRVAAQAYTVAKHTEGGVHSVTEIVAGDAAAVLLTAAAEGQLVVLGKSTTGAIDEWVVAPVAVRVAARSPRPVVLVPRPRSAAAAEREVAAVLGLGEPSDDERVAEFAAEAAQQTGTALTVLQIRRSRAHVPEGWIQEEAEWAQRFPGLEVHHSNLPGATAAQVLGATCPAPLLVLSAGHGTLLHRDLDAPHLWLLRHCTSPMALVPPVDRPDLAPGEIIAPG